jgi:hypothetical protein
VRGAKDRVQLLRVGILYVEAEQQGLHALKMFLGLLEKDLVELAEIESHS